MIQSRSEESHDAQDRLRETISEIQVREIEVLNVRFYEVKNQVSLIDSTFFIHLLL